MSDAVNAATNGEVFVVTRGMEIARKGAAGDPLTPEYRARAADAPAQAAGGLGF